MWVEILARARSFWLTFLHILFKWDSNESLSSTVMPNEHIDKKKTTNACISLTFSKPLINSWEKNPEKKISFWNRNFLKYPRVVFGTKYLRMDQGKFVEDIL